MKRLLKKDETSSSKSYVLTTYTNRPVTLDFLIEYQDREWSSPLLAEHRRAWKGMEGVLLKPDGQQKVGIATSSGLSSPVQSIECFWNSFLGGRSQQLWEQTPWMNPNSEPKAVTGRFS